MEERRVQNNYHDTSSHKSEETSSHSASEQHKEVVDLTEYRVSDTSP